ncbi:hypothetical protein [Pyxidicoccus xibeiensis]|uniref:hypothetical protein n=1 Tax=Pyxidicoccus xibeiensis TaxID=2906759 RepID=UPI0020A836B1|nr:hypothetical protein [Pyxidicoccus xibeiensis]MCP3136509.1 hypothetical protein [Pyxidicoccus xibeiensis]
MTPMTLNSLMNSKRSNDIVRAVAVLTAHTEPVPVPEDELEWLEGVASFRSRRRPGL